MTNPVSTRLAWSGLGLIGLWLVAEFVLLGPSSVVPTASNGEVIVPALLSERYAGNTGALWQTITSAGADKGVFTYYGTIDTFAFTALPGWLAHGLRAASVVVFGAVGAYALSRKVFAFGRPASLFVGAAYGVTLPAHLIAASLGYLPLVLLALFAVLEGRRRLLPWAGLAAALYLIADTSYFSQLIPWTMAAIVFWFVFCDTRTAARDWAVIAGSCVVLVLLRLDSLEALFANAPLAAIGFARATPEIMDVVARSFTRPYFLAHPTAALCAVLFAVGLASGGLGQKRAAGVGLALVVGLFLYPIGVALQSVATEFLPFLKGYRMQYAQRLPAVVLPFAAGFGVQALIAGAGGTQGAGGPGFPVYARRLALALCVGVLGFASLKAKYASLYNWVTNGSYVHNFASPDMEAFAETVRGRDSPVRVETFQLIPNYLHAYGLETAGGYQALHAKRYFEFWAKMVDPWASSIGPESRFYAQYSKRRALEGGMAFRDDRLWLFPDAYRPEWRLGGLYHLNFLSLANVGYLVSRDRLKDPQLTPVREMPRPWSSLGRREKTLENVRANFRGRRHFFVYENTDAFPRFFTVSGLSVHRDGAAVLDAMAEAPLPELRARAFVAGADLPKGVGPEESYATREITIERYAKDEIRLALADGGAALLVAANSYSPFWHVEIDGRAGEIFPAYHAFWGVRVPAGARSVVFSYWPPYRF